MWVSSSPVSGLSSLLRWGTARIWRSTAGRPNAHCRLKRESRQAGNQGVSCAQGTVYLGKKRATHALAERKRKEKSGCPLAAGRPVSHGKGRHKLSRGLDFSSLAACNGCSLKIWQQRFPRIKWPWFPWSEIPGRTRILLCHDDLRISILAKSVSRGTQTGLQSTLRLCRHLFYYIVSNAS